MTELPEEIEAAEAEADEAAEQAEQAEQAGDAEAGETEDAADPVEVREASLPTAAQLAAMSEKQLTTLVEQGVMTPDEVEKALKRFEKDQAEILDKLEREGERHRTRLAEILQEDVLNLVPCELCRADLAGWVDQTVMIPEEVKARVRIQIGDRQPENWQQDPHSQTCPACGGMGEVKTGSQKHGQTELPCVECGGKGWIPTDDARRGNVVPIVPALQSVAASNEPVAAPSDLPAIPPEIAQAYVVIPKPRAS